MGIVRILKFIPILGGKVAVNLLIILPIAGLLGWFLGPFGVVLSIPMAVITILCVDKLRE